MVATISALKNAAQAVSYYEAGDDYYAEGENAPSAWQGKGAEALELSGPVDRDKFAKLLAGEVSGQKLGTMQDGEWFHRPGWDLTFSAPKSASVMAEVVGDRRLIEAHNKAVQAALALAEANLAATRIREDSTIRREATGSLVIASFDHSTSRALDPQLHTHNVILNMTQDADGAWRSLEPRAFYQMQKQLGAVYRQGLATEVQRLGYTIEADRDSNFEITGIDKKVLEAFSQRSVAIEARLAERGHSREESSAAERQIAALDTRQVKQAVSQEELVKTWRSLADELGWDATARQNLVAQAEQRAAKLSSGADQSFAREVAADRVVAQGAAMLGERESVFSVTSLHEAAGRFGMGKVTHAEIKDAIKRSEAIGSLQPREYLDRRGVTFAGFTTASNIESETTLLRLEVRGRAQMQPLASPVAAARAVAEAERRSAAHGHAWNDEQRLATEQILTSCNRIVALQGVAGTAKTSTVLATVAREAKARGIAVTALAPTASAAQVLGDALNARTDTLARHLLAPGKPSRAERLWIVDEASLVSAKDTAKLLTLAESHRARVLLVGDTAQLGSIEAGAAFGQLQHAGMQTAHLTQILRQTNAQAKAAVEASLAGDAKRAMAALDNGGGKIVEQATREARLSQIAKDYATLDEAARKRTLVIEPSREGRDQLTAQIRQQLAERGALTGPAVTASRLVPKDLTRAEAKVASSYAIGDTIRFAKDYADKGVSKTVAYRVTHINAEKASITLSGENGKAIDWHLRQWGASHAQAFKDEPIELRAGDKVQFTRNDRQLRRINGLQAEVLSVNPQTQQATLKLATGRKESLDLTNPRDQHITHGYVATVFAAQGRTADRVLVHAESTSTRLVDQKSLYVAISRARETTAIYTDDRVKLETAIREQIGVKQSALSVSAATCGNFLEQEKITSEKTQHIRGNGSMDVKIRFLYFKARIS